MDVREQIESKEGELSEISEAIESFEDSHEESSILQTLFEEQYSELLERHKMAAIERDVAMDMDETGNCVHTQLCHQLGSLKEALIEAKLLLQFYEQNRFA